MCLIGRTSAGKTTLINSLLDKERFPHNAQPTTSVVTEIYDSQQNKSEECYLIDEQMNRKKVSQKEFNNVFKNPEDFQGRLQLASPDYPEQLRAKIFDTPGYDSIYDKHSEVLREFIPEADYLIFVVLYRTGMTKSDKEFIDDLLDIFGQDLPPIVLAINRVPSQIDNVSLRIDEIKRDVKELLGFKPQSFLIEEDRRENFSLPDTFHLWNYLGDESNNRERQLRIYKNLASIEESLLYDLRTYLNNIKKINHATEEKIQRLIEEIDKLEQKKLKFKKYITKKRNQIITETEDKLNNSVYEIKQKAKNSINSTNKWTKASECSSYITSHLLPEKADKSSRRIAKFVYHELESLNQELEDMVNTAIGDFQEQVNVIFDKNAGLKEGVVVDAAGKVLNKAAVAFFAKFGGRGGAGAGVANYASKLLSKAGKIFGKTFSRGTHSSLKTFLKRIGATSTRGIQAGIVIIVEAAMYFYKVATWQKKLYTKTEEAIEEWSKELEPKLQDEIKKSTQASRSLVDDAINSEIDVLRELINNQESYKQNQFDLTAELSLVEELENKLNKLQNDIVLKNN